MGGNNSIAPQSDHLPPINQSHQIPRGRDNSYLGPSKHLSYIFAVYIWIMPELGGEISIEDIKPSR